MTNHPPLDDASALTRRLLIDAGIASGMRVLDVGCGYGLVSRLAADIVGARGQVVGVDRDAAALALARSAAEAFPNIQFAEAELASLPNTLGTFDAVIGRRVLMYVPDVVSVVRSLAEFLRPGGITAFQEHDATMTPASTIDLPLHRQVHGWMWGTVEREGGDLHMGFSLFSVLSQAGLAVQKVRAEALVTTPDAPDMLTSIVRAMLPRIVAHGCATEEAMGLDTLAERLTKERVTTGATWVGDIAFCAWAHKHI